MKYVHLVNGDATAYLLRKAGIKDKIIVWREMLCEGPSVLSIGSKEFVRTRSSYLNRNYSENSKEYNDLFVSQLKLLESNASKDSVIILWFEFDFFCQINLMAALSYISPLKWGSIELICPADKELGCHQPEEISPLLPTPVVITEKHLQAARKFWKTWNSGDHAELRKSGSAEFPLLKNALQGYFELAYPGNDGLNEVERFLLNNIKEGKLGYNELIKAALNNPQFRILGWGDSQYVNALQGLSELYESKKKMELTNLGRQVAIHKAKLNRKTALEFGGVTIR